MTRRMIIGAASLTLLAALSARAAAQQQVDLRLNLSSQPVYSPFGQMPEDYLGASGLYSSGNIRGGRAFLGRRNFLEDRYFSSRFARFYRDSVGVQDIQQGAAYGPGQPFYAPGSMVSRGSIAGGVTAGAYRADPFSLSFSNTSSPFVPFGATYSRTLESGEPALSASPTYVRMMTALAQQPALAGEGQPPPMPYASPFAPPPEAGERTAGRPAWAFWKLLERNLRPPELENAPWENMELEALQSVMPPGVMPPREPGIRPLDYLRWRYGSEEFFPQAVPEAGAEAAEQPAPQAPLVEALKAEQPRPEGQQEAPGLKLPQVPATLAPAPRGPLGADEQFFRLARADLEAGAYLPAAEAFHKAGVLSPALRWDATCGEAFARLLLKDYNQAAYFLKVITVERPDWLRQDFRAGEIVNRPADWQATEQALAEILEHTPDAPHQAFAMACLKLFTGRAAEAAPYLKVAEKNDEYTEAIQILRRKFAL